jgi:endonuclease/exonuclease/phosphatase (EEP) superfamily protein YafD
MFVAMTYNVANGLAKPADLVAALRASFADVIGLEELAPDQAIAIERDLRDLYPHQILHPLGIPGKGVISRFPIASAELVSFYPDRPDLVVTLDGLDAPIRVIVAHPPPPRFRKNGFHFDAQTRRQIDALVELATAGGPTILMGDFNAPERHRSLRQLAAAGLIDAFRAAGEGGGLTLPMRLARYAYKGNPLGKLRIPPMLRVDYIWHTPELTTLSAWVGDHAGSDHLPVLARLSLARGSR